MKRLVLLGGGHAHLSVLQEYAGRPDELTSLTLITPHPTLIYTGMLPGCIAGHYSLEESSIDLMRLAGRAHAAFVATTGVLVNPMMREVVCADGNVLPYDVLSIDIGSRTAFGDVKGAQRHAIGIRPLEGALVGIAKLLEAARQGRLESVSVVGGGAGGVELAFALERRLKADLPANTPHVRLISDSPVVLPGFSRGARERAARLMHKRNIGLHVGSAVAEVGVDFLRLASAISFASDATVWVAGASAPELFRDSGFATDAKGFLSVNDQLQSRSHPEVFGAGDCATNESLPRDKAGVFAVRAGPVLAANLRSAIAGTPLQRWTPRKRYLALISTGDRHAIGVWGGFSWQGKWAWNWKDRIDRRFVETYAIGNP